MPKKIREVERCEHCGSVISKRIIQLYSGMIGSLYRVYKHMEKQKKYTFTRKEIKHLFRSENDTARFGDLVMFGGLVFKTSKAHYSLNMDRCRAFFAGNYTIPAFVVKDPVTKTITQGPDVGVRDIRNLTTMLNANGEYEPLYM